jgi:cyclopropane fatty-acyl-phospholipid synthase-like methyltransferase
LNAAFTIAAVRPGMRVLDLGCGRGEIVRHCAELGASAPCSPGIVRLPG